MWHMNWCSYWPSFVALSLEHYGEILACCFYGGRDSLCSLLFIVHQKAGFHPECCNASEKLCQLKGLWESLFRCMIRRKRQITWCHKWGMQEDVNDTEAQSLLLAAVTAGAPFSKASSGGIVISVIQLPFGLVFSCTLLSRPSIHTVGGGICKWNPCPVVQDQVSVGLSHVSNVLVERQGGNRVI